MSESFKCIYAVLCLAALWASSGCSSQKKVHRQQQRLLRIALEADRGDVASARRHYESALEDVQSRSTRRYIKFELARLAKQSGDLGRAEALYRELTAGQARDRFAAKAMYQLSNLAEQKNAGFEKIATLKARIITTYPGYVASDFALEDLVKLYRGASRLDEVVPELKTLHERVKGSPIGDNLLFRAAQICRRDLDRPDKALRVYRRLITDYPERPLSNHAIWEMSQLYEARQQWDPALKLLRRLADQTDRSWLFQTYTPAKASNSRLRLGLIHLLFLEKPESAIAHFEQFQSQFPGSLYVDDAAWHIVQAYRLMDASARHREALERFLREHPDSRYIRVIRRRHPKIFERHAPD